MSGLAQRNLVGQSFLPDKSQLSSTVLQTQRVTNQAPQPNNAYLLANLHANVTLTSGPPFAYTALTWDVVTDLITLGLQSPVTGWTLFPGIWTTQVNVVFGGTSDGGNMRITCRLPTNFASDEYTQYGPSNIGFVFSQQVIIQDPSVSKTVATAFPGVGLYYQSTTAGATVSTLSAQLIITKFA